MRSKFEVSLSKKLKGCDYEPEESILKYQLKPSHYLPDFVPKREKNVIIEAKGRFRTRLEAQKYLAIRDCNPDITLVFVFMDPGTPMPGARKRKDGTRFSMAEWADKNDITWYTIKTLPKRWCQRC